MRTITIPQKLANKDDLIVIPRKEYERFVAFVAKKEVIRESDVLRWSKEAKKLKKAGKLPILPSLKNLR